MEETFFRKNDIGVDIEYYIIARVNEDNRDYIIYTDYVSDEEDGYRLFVDMVNDGRYTTISDTGRDIILKKFREEIDKYYKNAIGE